MTGWRKFSLALLTLVLAFVLALFGKLSADFATVASIAVASFAGGNAIEHMSKRGER